MLVCPCVSLSPELCSATVRSAVCYRVCVCVLLLLLSSALWRAERQFTQHLTFPWVSSKDLMFLP